MRRVVLSPLRLLPLLALLFCTSLALAAGPLTPALSPQAQQGRDLAKKAQCNRCHDFGAALAPAKKALHCVNCHNWILDTKGHPDQIAKQRKGYPDWDRYLENVNHFTRLPVLTTLTRRVRPSYVRHFLDAPRDLRPHLDESMIPLRLTPADKDAIVAWLVELAGPNVVPEEPLPPAPSAARIEAGRSVFMTRGCPMCHVLGNIRFQPGMDAAFFKAVGETAKLAPNLRFARERVPRSVFVRYVQDPQAVDPSVTMPKLGVTPDEAEKLADFVLYVNPELPPGPAAADVKAPTVPALTRRVTYDEVYDEVFGRVCIHCHMNPKTNAGEGGAGNTGGLTYAGRRLNLEQYAGFKQGAFRDGKWVDILKPQANGAPPLLLEVLLQRHREGTRDQRAAFADSAGEGVAPNPDAPGMPLGLPAISVAQLSLIKTWLDEGAPGPEE